MKLLTVIKDGKEKAIEDFTRQEFMELLQLLTSDVLQLYHRQEIQFKIEEDGKELVYPIYQLGVQKLFFMIHYLKFMLQHMDYRGIAIEMELSNLERSIIKDYMNYDMKVSAVAKKKQLHRHQVYQYFQSIEQKTGLSPRKFDDLVQLSVLIAKGA